MAIAPAGPTAIEHPGRDHEEGTARPGQPPCAPWLRPASVGTGDLTMRHVQQRDNRWCIVDLVGKHGRVRTVPMPAWTKNAIDTWTTGAECNRRASVPIHKPGRSGQRRSAFRKGGLADAQDLCGWRQFAGHRAARPASNHSQTVPEPPAGSSNRFNCCWGHSSVQTTERYLGTKQDLAHAPNDAIKLKLLRNSTIRPQFHNRTSGQLGGRSRLNVTNPSILNGRDSLTFSAAATLPFCRERLFVDRCE